LHQQQRRRGVPGVVQPGITDAGLGEQRLRPRPVRPGVDRAPGRTAMRGLLKIRTSLDVSVIPGYTYPVKTAISVPDETFQQASERAQQLGISRSEFFATAAQRYLADLDRESLTARIDQALDLVGEDPDTKPAIEVGRSRLAESEW